MAIIAWIMLGCASVIIARHFKGVLKKLIGGAAVWFQVGSIFKIFIYFCLMIIIFQLSRKFYLKMYFENLP